MCVCVLGGGGLLSDSMWNCTWLTKPLKKLGDNIITVVTIWLTSNAAPVELLFGLSRRKWERVATESWSSVQMLVLP